MVDITSLLNDVPTSYVSGVFMSGVYCFILYLSKVLSKDFTDKMKNSYWLSLFSKFYNIFQVVFNAFIVGYCFYSWSTIPNEGTVVDTLKQMTGIYCAEVTWQINVIKLYLLAKYIDWFDTVLIVLRGNKRQLSWLHIIHHIVMPWPFVHGLQVNEMALYAYTYEQMINSFIHVLLYSYYFLSTTTTYGPYVRRHKLKLTTVQLIQFVSCMVVVTGQVFTECHSNCGFIMNYSLALLMTKMFYSFYKQESKKSESDN
jgi:hypothetical protein